MEFLDYFRSLMILERPYNQYFQLHVCHLIAAWPMIEQIQNPMYKIRCINIYLIMCNNKLRATYVFKKLRTIHAVG